ncbi:hypothetical protein GTV15_20455 [Streptomyces sp. SID7803]|nr:hypothetical protein [Streptomyces sp. SID7803]
MRTSVSSIGCPQHRQPAGRGRVDAVVQEGGKKFNAPPRGRDRRRPGILG